MSVNEACWENGPRVAVTSAQVALLSDWILSCDVIGGASATKFPDGVLCERGVRMVCGCAAVKRSPDHASLRSVSPAVDHVIQLTVVDYKWTGSL